MKVQWEETDIRKGRRVWRDLPCMIVKTDDGEHCALIVLETGRIMTLGDAAHLAAYMTEWDYRPTKEK